MAIRDLSRGDTVELIITADGASDVVRLVGENIRSVQVQPHSESFSATATELKVSNFSEAISAPTTAPGKQVEPDIKAGGDIFVVDPVQFLWCETSGYASGTLRVRVRAVPT